MSPAGFPHSDTLGSQLCCQLLEAYRRLLRPSSAPGAQTSTVCPYKLAIPTTLDTLDNNRGHPKAPRSYIPEPKDARVHYTVLKQRPDTHPPPTTYPPPLRKGERAV